MHCQVFKTRPPARTRSPFLLEDLETRQIMSMVVWDGGHQLLWGPEELTAATPQCWASDGGDGSALAGQSRTPQSICHPGLQCKTTA